jgi:hypothetical protein
MQISVMSLQQHECYWGFLQRSVFYCFYELGQVALLFRTDFESATVETTVALEMKSFIRFWQKNNKEQKNKCKTYSKNEV